MQVPCAALPTSTDDKTRVGLSFLPPGSVPPQVLLLPVCPAPPFLSHLASWITRLRLCTSVEMVLLTPGRARVGCVGSTVLSSMLSRVQTPSQCLCWVLLVHVATRGTSAPGSLVALTSCLGTLGGHGAQKPLRGEGVFLINHPTRKIDGVWWLLGRRLSKTLSRSDD